MFDCDTSQIFGFKFDSTRANERASILLLPYCDIHIYLGVFMLYDVGIGVVVHTINVVGEYNNQ
jgi:hypothetical protein